MKTALFSRRRWLAVPALLVLVPWAALAQPGTAPRSLRLTLRDSPPPPPARASTGNSSMLSTAGAPAQAGEAGATVVGTASHDQVLRAAEGQPFRVELPSTASLRFRVPVKAGAAGGPFAGGVVTFETVAGFVARIKVADKRVTVALTPLRAGTVAAELPPERPSPLEFGGRLGEWIALADGESASQSGLWVKVEFDAADASPR